MNNSETDEMMTAEVFFGVSSGDKGPGKSAERKARAKKSPDEFFEELKVKTVMRIYGVSRTRALEIIAGRDGERKALEDAKEKAREVSRRQREESAEEFFGGV